MQRSMLTVKNFKKIRQFSLPLDKDLLVIGPNGSGKTQFLWAYLFFFRAYNNQSQTNSFAPIHLKTEVLTLLDQRFHGLRDYTSFLNRSYKGKGKALFEASFTGGRKFEVSLLANGNLVLSNGKSHEYDNSELHFAYMNSSYLFNAQVGLPSNDLLTSNENSLRYHFSRLNSKSQDSIFALMESLFSLKKHPTHNHNIKNSISENIYFTMEHDDFFDGDENNNNTTVSELENGEQHDKIEVMFLPSGLQKVFASLILLYSLIEVTPKNNATTSLKYYLIDDIDTELDNDTTELFYKFLLNLCHSNSIFLLASAKSMSVNFVGDDSNISGSLDVLNLNGKPTFKSAKLLI